MKVVLCGLLVMMAAQFSNAAEPGKPAINAQQVYLLPVFDACMDEYNQLTQINQEAYNSAVAYCHTVYQDPYNMLCHGQAILTWSGYQDQIFDYLVMCQNGNYGKDMPDKN